MNEQTQVIAPEGERTQMVGSLTCPVCGEENAGGAVWCAECGFRLGTEAGEAPVAEAGFALSGEGQRYPLKAGENVVGRLNADVFLSDPSVSRRHATVVVREDAVLVRDEGSSNGTKVAGTRVASGVETPMRAGDTVQFGNVTMTLEAPSGWEPAEMPERAESPAAEAPAAEALTAEDASAIEAAPAVAVLTDGVQSYPLHEGANSIGRRSENDIILADPYISGRHAVLTIRDGEASIADSGSSNGTFLEERRLVPGAEETVAPGALIRFGRISLNYEAIPPQTAETLSADPEASQEAQEGA